jgi:multimeric flavodoxin WrbA
MANKALVINGSLRAGGNTDTLVARMLEGAASAGVAASLHVLRDKKLAGCRGCYSCYENPRCAVRDDMQELHLEIQGSGLLVLASPMYWWGVTGLMKTFIDRLYLYYPPANREMIAGKKAIIITPMHVSEGEHGAEAFRSEIEPLRITYGHILKRLGISIIDMVFFPGLTGSADARENRKYLENAFEIGRGLSEPE